MDKLKPCPFCGSEAAEPVFIGNDHTKKRTVTIKCKAPGCTKGVTVGALRFSHEWCHEEAVKKWNTRTPNAALAASEARIAYLEQLASERLEQMTADAEKIVELEEAFTWSMHNWGNADAAHSFSLFVLGRGGDGDLGDCFSYWKSTRHAAALLKEKK